MTAGPGAATAPADSAHAHAWAAMRFELVDDRPVVRQQCESCGLTRRYRASDRAWVPGQPEVHR